MLIELNTRQIADEMMAITALRSLAAPDAAAASRRLLTTAETDGLYVIMRMTFAEIIMQLSAQVKHCEIDTGYPQQPLFQAIFTENDPIPQERPGNRGPRLAVEFRNDELLPPGMWMALKRQMEHAVAAATLEWVITDTDAPLAATLREKRHALSLIHI